MIIGSTVLQVQGQDIILLTSGKKINTKVIEISDFQIKYKHNPIFPGPARVIKRSKVYMIKYENGAIEKISDIIKKPVELKGTKDLIVVHKAFGNDYYTEGQEISKREFLKIIGTQSIAKYNFLEGANLYNLGNVIGIPASGLFGYFLAGVFLENNGGVKTEPLFLSGGAMLAGIILNGMGRRKIHNAIKGYNAQLNSGLNIQISGQGLGLAFSF